MPQLLEIRPARAVLALLLTASVAHGQRFPSPPAADSDEGAVAAPDPEDEPGFLDRLGAALRFRYLHGEADGFLQTPTGGLPGTTSRDRPALEEIGIDDVDIFDGSLSLHFDRHIVNVGGQFIRAEGSARLSSDLISQGVMFPAGTPVESEVRLDWHRLGYQYEFILGAGRKEPQFRVAPGVTAILFDFEYKLTAPGGLRVRRDYPKGGVQLGGTAAWLLGGGLSIEGSGWWGIPVGSGGEILVVELVARYRIWGERDGPGGAIFSGVAFENIEYRDKQQSPNHINIDLGPLFVAGAEIRF